MIVLYVLFILLMCLDNIWVYNKTCSLIAANEKQKAYILSIKSSMTMLILGCFAVFQFIQVSYSPNEYLKSNQMLNMFAVLCFISYLICDCVIGSIEYKKHLQTLSGYTHHIAYIFINIVSLVTGKYPLYMLYMIEELPTLLLSIGRYNKKYRNDIWFGLTFFLTRILYHIFLTWYLRDDKIIVAISLMVLPLHMYWFYGWCKALARRRK